MMVGTRTCALLPALALAVCAAGQDLPPAAAPELNMRQDLRRSLVMFLSFDRDEGTTAKDESGHANDATLLGAVPVPDGRYGRAIHFDGRGARVERENPRNLPEKRNPRTLSMWFRMNTYDRWAVVGGYGNTRPGENFQIESGNGQRFWIMGWASHRDWCTGILSEPYCDGKWHHIAVTYDAHITKVYLDGILKASTRDFKWDTLPAWVVIGEEIDRAGRPFDGDIDEFMIFDRELNARAVRSLYLLEYR
jgi:sialidase-1